MSKVEGSASPQVRRPRIFRKRSLKIVVPLLMSPGASEGDHLVSIRVLSIPGAILKYRAMG